MTARRKIRFGSSRVRSQIHLIFLLTFIIAVLVSYFVSLIIDNRSIIMKTSDDSEIETETAISIMDPVLKNMWLSNKAINADYVGQIIFDSGLVDLPVVQARDVYDRNGEFYEFYTEEGYRVTEPEGYTGNDVYIWSDWKTHEYDPHGEGGSVFMHCQNILDDQNIIIFGHHFARDFDPSGSVEFTPLDLLLDENNYKENCSLKLILDNEIRDYKVAGVFIMDINDDYDTQIMRTDLSRDLSGNYDPFFCKKFIEHMNRISAYRTGESLNESDQILTLITCIEHKPELRQVVICRQTDTYVYED